jgi:hypothetical protein
MFIVVQVEERDVATRRELRCHDGRDRTLRCGSRVEPA